jgi:hypothetical protein
MARGYLTGPDFGAERFVAIRSRTTRRRACTARATSAAGAPTAASSTGPQRPPGEGARLRVEPGEIEARLVACAGVREAVVVAREDTPGDGAWSPTCWRTAMSCPTSPRCAPSSPPLPEYMVPAAFVVLERFPLSPNGKLDRKACRSRPQRVLTRDYEAPQGATEALLARLWEELLGVDRVGRTTTSSSSAAIRCASSASSSGCGSRAARERAQRVRGADAVRPRGASMRAAAPRPPCRERDSRRLRAHHAGHAAARRADPGEIDGIEQRVPGGARAIQDIYPLSPLQEGILFHHLLQDDGDAYCCAGCLRSTTRRGSRPSSPPCRSWSTATTSCAPQ